MDLIKMIILNLYKNDILLKREVFVLEPEKCRSNLRQNYFSCRVVNVWNSLPLYVRTSTSVNNFKNNYDEYLLQVK